MQVQLNSPFGVDKILIEYTGENSIRINHNDSIITFGQDVNTKRKRLPWNVAVELAEINDELIIKHPMAATVLAERSANRKKEETKTDKKNDALVSELELNQEKSAKASRSKSDEAIKSKVKA